MLCLLQACTDYNINTNEAWIYGDMAIAKYKIEKYKEALYEINKALKFEPENNMFLKLKEEILKKYRG